MRRRRSTLHLLYATDELHRSTASSVFELERGEEAQSLALVESQGMRYYVVGTVRLDSATPEPTDGRLVVISVSEAGDPRQVSTARLGGCPYALVALSNGLLASAVNSQVSPG